MTSFDPPGYADLDPDPWELDQLNEVLAEVAGEEAAGAPYDDDDDGYGEPDDLARLEAIGDTLDATYATDAQRQAEDEQDAAMLMLRPSVEDKIARARQRIEAGTYTTPQALRPARDAEGMFSVSCGEAVDATGRCASRYHQAGCHTVTEAAASNGSADEARAWRAMLAGYVSGADVAQAAAGRELGMASPVAPQHQSWDDLLAGPAEGTDAGLRSAVARYMGLADGPSRPAELPREPMPDVAGIREAMGL